MRDLLLGIVSNLMAAVLLSVGSGVDLQALAPDRYFSAGALAVGLALVPAFVALRWSVFVGLADGPLGALVSQSFFVIGLGIMAIVQIIPPFAIAQRYASGVWCPLDLTNPLFMRTIEIFLFAGVAAGEFRLVRSIVSSAASGASISGRGLEAFVLFMAGLVIAGAGFYGLQTMAVPEFAAIFPDGLSCLPR